MTDDREAQAALEPGRGEFTQIDRMLVEHLAGRASAFKPESARALNVLLAAYDAKVAECERMRERKDGAYNERNQVVAGLAALALANGFKVGTARTAIEGWSDDWHGCVYIDLPTGQVSWHYHDSQAVLFAALPAYQDKWDGHDTPEKYRRVAALAAKEQTK